MVFICGPTAVGKSEVAFLVAEQLGGEIISVDSMQVYRGMDIGTAKPSTEDRKRVPHHLIDIVEITEPFDAAKFVRLASAAAEQIRARGKFPIFCGGTGFYFKAFLDGLGDAPPADLELRAKLENIPVSELLAELQEKDAETFRRIDRQNPRRVIRAIEVIRLTGRPFSEQRSTWGQSSDSVDGCFFCLERAKADLHVRIDARVDTIFRQGLVRETQSLLENGLMQNKIASQALGYRQVMEHLQRGVPLDETIEMVKLRTRQFAKRQMTWFRRQLPVRWIHVSATHSADQIAAQVIAEFAAIHNRNTG